MTALDYNSGQAALRLRRLQFLCRQNGLDGVLLIPGVDGRFSVCNQAMGYILEGRSNRDTVDVVKLGDQLEDAVALITPAEVSLYVPTPELHDQLQDLLVPHVAGLRMLNPTRAETSDPDLLEENKLASFVHMLRGCKRIGIPCNLATYPSPHRGMDTAASNGGSPYAALPQLSGDQLIALEKWPLLQAYGLEGVGRSGFFTMNFEVFDVQAHLQRLYGELDARSLALLLTDAAPTLRQHWDEMLQALGGRPAGQRGGLSEKQVVEPLAGYFAYGLLRVAPGVEQAVTMPPRAIFGPRSADDSAASEAVPLASCGPAPGMPPLHLVVEAADPRSPLRVARTYFLTRGVADRNLFADRDEEAEQGYSYEAATAGWAAQADDAVMLMRLYTALVDAARAAMMHFATTDNATAHSAKAEAQDVLARRAEQLGVAGGSGGGAALAGRLRFTLCQCDHANHVTAPAVRGSSQLKILRLSLPGVASRSGPLAGKLLGGLVYADTFLDVPRLVVGDGQPAKSSGSLLVLTDGVPPLVAIPAGGCEEGLAARALRSLSKVVESMAGAAPTRAAGLASQRDQERRAAAAAAESQTLAAKLRARRTETSSADAEHGEDEVAYQVEDDGAEEPPAPGGTATGDSSASRPVDALGKLLTLGGGDEAVLLTGASSCPALSGMLYCFTGGLVFVEGASKATWLLDLRRPNELEAVTMQQLPLALPPSTAVFSGTGVPSNASTSSTSSLGPTTAVQQQGHDSGAMAGLGEAVVFRGTTPTCGLAPACHLTTNTHVALPLAAMSPTARRFLIQSVLPAWQQTCREAAAATPSSSAASYLKDMAAPNPFPSALHSAHAYAIQTSSAGGIGKTWSAVMAEDSFVQAAVESLDEFELCGPLSGLDPRVEALLLQPKSPSAVAERSSPGGAVTLVVGLPGGDQASVAAAVVSMLGEQVAARVAMLPQSAGPLKTADFVAALSAAASAAAGPSGGAGHLVLTTSSYLSLPEQLRMLAVADASGAAGQWRLHTVVVCCSADAMYEEPSRSALAGGMLGQLAPGCVDCVVLAGTDAAKVATLAQLVSARLPDVAQVRSGRTQLLRAREELLPNQAERIARLSAPQAVAGRRWAPLAAAGSGKHSCSGGGLLGPLQASRVAFEGVLDVAKLRDALRPLGVPQDPSQVPLLPLADTAEAAVAGLVCVTGCVRLGPGARPSELVGTRQAALRTREWPLEEASIILGGPLLPTKDQVPGGELTFVGTGSILNERALRKLMAICSTGAQASTALPVPSSAAQLSAEQKANIRAARLFDPLPDGYCFNGTQYFDAFGDASLNHPDMDRFMAEWLAEQQANAAMAISSLGDKYLSVLRATEPVRL